MVTHPLKRTFSFSPPPSPAVRHLFIRALGQTVEPNVGPLDCLYVNWMNPKDHLINPVFSIFFCSLLFLFRLTQASDESEAQPSSLRRPLPATLDPYERSSRTDSGSGGGGGGGRMPLSSRSVVGRTPDRSRVCGSRHLDNWPRGRRLPRTVSQLQAQKRRASAQRRLR